jgi:hypothetical protein
MNLFTLARKNLEKSKKPFTNLQVLDLAIAIRKQLDKEVEDKRRKRNRKYYLKRIKTKK